MVPSPLDFLIHHADFFLKKCLAPLMNTHFLFLLFSRLPDQLHLRSRHLRLHLRRLHPGGHQPGQGAAGTGRKHISHEFE